jgi:hypothetical protein
MQAPTPALSVSIKLSADEHLLLTNVRTRTTVPTVVVRGMPTYAPGKERRRRINRTKETHRPLDLSEATEAGVPPRP